MLHDTLVDVLAKSLNQKFKDKDKTAFFLDGENDDSPCNIIDWISTGSSVLDLAISNRPNGGIPVSRVSEITGETSCVTEDTIIEVIIE